MERGLGGEVCMKKVSVIIVNYNTKPILQDCLHNLEGSYPNLEIIVVDNASADGSAEMVKASFPNVVLIENENNGLAAGSNLGLTKATGDYYLFMGSDAFPAGDAISQLVNYMDQAPYVGIATCKLVLRNGELDWDAHRGFPTPWAALTHFTKLNKLFPHSRIFNRYFLGWEDMNKPHEIDLCISHFMLVKKEVIEQIGKWDEHYFLYGEDVDFCYRAKQAGWQIMYLPFCTAVHYKGVSVGIRKETQDITSASTETRERIKKTTTDAMKLFYKKHYQGKYPAIVTNFVLAGIDLMRFIRS